MNAKRKPVLLHADWSVKPEGRALAIAVPSNGGWRVEHLVAPVRDDWLLKLLAEIPRPAVLAMDLPLGVPEAYLKRLGLDTFPDLLAKLDAPEFAAFGEPAKVLSEISLHRPFYPAGVNGATQADLVVGLGLDGAAALRRRCDRSPPLRVRAAPPFWTIGAQQVGKAALAAWYGIVRPALRDQDAVLWPFAGELDDLIAAERLVLAESYPSEARRRLAPGNGARPIGAAANRAAILNEALASFDSIDMPPDLSAEAAKGFATRDEFDALVGLLGMIRAAEDGWRSEPPRETWVMAEGWMLLPAN